MKWLTGPTREKRQQRRDVERAFESRVADCEGRMSEVLHASVGGARTARNALAQCSAVSPARSIKGCDVIDGPAGPCAAYEMAPHSR